jgi:PadR family transcriptional regulator, regulatory protein PadR
VSNHQRELYSGLIRIHVLLHASHEPIFGLAMMEELAHHGYRIGSGTVNPSCTAWNAAVC